MNKAELQRLLKTSGTSPLGQVRFRTNDDVVYHIIGVKMDDEVGSLVIQGEYSHTIDPNVEPDVAS